MPEWLSYFGAFAGASGAAVLCYLAAFTGLMSSSGFASVVLVVPALILPVLAGVPEKLQPAVLRATILFFMGRWTVRRASHA